MKMRSRLATMAMALALSACMTPPAGAPGSNPAQAAITTTTNAYKALGLAIDSTDAALTTGAIRAKDGRAALDAFTVSQRALDGALANLRAGAAAAAASGAKP